VAKSANRQKIKVDDFKFAIRKDKIKLGRVEELLYLQKEITEAKKMFDNSEGQSAKTADKDDKEVVKAEKGKKSRKKEKAGAS
jgi:transcription initiation factor TFIID subunit 13